MQLSENQSSCFQNHHLSIKIDSKRFNAMVCEHPGQVIYKGGLTHTALVVEERDRLHTGNGEPCGVAASTFKNSMLRVLISAYLKTK